MAITDHFPFAGRSPVAGRAWGSRQGGRSPSAGSAKGQVAGPTASGLLAAAVALRAGARAAADYRRLSALPEGDLRRMGLDRDGVPREMFRRHFGDRD